MVKANKVSRNACNQHKRITLERCSAPVYRETANGGQRYCEDCYRESIKRYKDKAAMYMRWLVKLAELREPRP